MADASLVYKHSAHCSAAIQMFVDCNPQYWCFVPMPRIEAQKQNLTAGLAADSTIFDSRSTSLLTSQTRRDQEASTYMHHLPAVPSENYAFSAWQRSKQLQTFKHKRDCLTPNIHLDLYDAAIVTVRKTFLFDTYGYCLWIYSTRRMYRIVLSPYRSLVHHTCSNQTEYTRSSGWNDCGE